MSVLQSWEAFQIVFLVYANTHQSVIRVCVPIKIEL